MKLKFAKHSHVQDRKAKRDADYWPLVSQAIVQETPDGFYFDADHPAWTEAMKKYRSPAVMWGPRMWAELHNRPAAFKGDAIAEKRWMDTFTIRLPRGACGCRGHWMALLEDMPPDLSSAEAYHAWTVAAHNAVNRRLGKREWTVEEART